MTGKVHSAVEAAREKAQDWLFGAALPLWSQEGRTPSGLFAERISLSGQPDSSYYRSFVQSRHIYSFAEAGMLGWQGPWERLAAETMAQLLKNARRSDGLVVHKVDVEGIALDKRADLYDQAFLLFALGKAGESLNRADLFDEAEKFLGVLETEWAMGDGGFFEGEIVDTRIRRQNPHMHLLEAFLCLYEGSRRELFLDRAYRIAALCERHFIDDKTGALLEYFDADLNPVKGEQGEIVEPGHCFEWAWLLQRLAVLGWPTGSEISRRLVDFGRLHGIDAVRGVAINEVSLDGRIINPSARLWPQTERLKAAISLYRVAPSALEAKEIVEAAAGLENYLKVDIPGLWRDKYQPDGSWIEELSPGSSLYHIVCGFAELMRI